MVSSVLFSQSFENPKQIFPPSLTFPLYLSAGAGADANRPPCRKAKELRKERRRQKEQMRHNADGVVSPPPPAPTLTQTNQPKPLEDFISDSLTNSSSHCLEVSTMSSKF